MNLESKREYPLSDGEMLTAGEVMFGHFKEHQNDFFIYEPSTFNPEFVVTIDTALAAAHSCDIDAIERGRQTKETADVKNAASECDDAFHDLEFFVRQNYGAGSHMIDLFGIADFGHARKSHPRFVLFMESLAHTLSLHRDELLAAGLKQSLADAIPLLAQRLRLEKVSQRSVMRARAVHTSERIDALNVVWRLMVIICDGAKGAFRANEKLRKLFKLPVRRNGGSDDVAVPPPAVK